MTEPQVTGGTTIISEEALEAAKAAQYFIESHRAQGNTIWEGKGWGDDSVTFVARTPDGVEVARHEWKKP